MTYTEKQLWQRLRSKKLCVKFLRQHPIYVLTEDSGQFRFIIADFYCDAFKLIIELDGEIHTNPEIELLDTYKETLLLKQWYKVLRFNNSEIHQNLNLCIDIIQSFCSPSP